MPLPGTAQECTIIYITPTGASSGVSGTKLNPANLLYGLTLADSVNSQLHIASGFYSLSTTLNMASDVTMEGGFNDTSWVKTNAVPTVIFRDSSNISTSPNRLIAISCIGVSNFRLQDLTISVANAVGDGVTTYGLYLDSCSGYSITRCDIIAGNGSDGLTGLPGLNGVNGANGVDGEQGDGDGPCCTLGGLGGDSSYAGSYAGGKGGDGGARGTGTNLCSGPGNTAFNGEIGIDGLGPSGGPGGPGGDSLCYSICTSMGCDATPANDGDDGTIGGNGGNGATGQNGTVGFGSYFSNGDGLTGQDGQHGSGGGGGGGGGSQGCLWSLFGNANGSGAGGGGGGEGGQGGFGGSGGGGAGSSFGLYIHTNGMNSEISQCTINSGLPGNGGIGAPGGLGGFGGNGGLGISSDCDLGVPGDGGTAGDGGLGGLGGSGVSGVAANIYQDTTGIPIDTLDMSIVQQPHVFVEYTGCVNSVVVFSTDTVGTITWDFGTGSVPSTCNGSICSTYFASTGRKTITLTVDSMTFTYADYVRIDSTDTVTNPTITTLNSGNVCPGDTSSFECDITATNYTWIIQQGSFSDTVTGSGYQTLTYPLDSVGTYTISLATEDACCGLSSLPDTITVTVNAIIEPVIVIQSSDSLNTACDGANLSFDAIATNLDSPLYQWYLNGVPVGADSSSYENSAMSDTDNVYCAVVNNSGCAAGLIDTSNTITVTIDPVLVPAIAIQSNDSSNTACEGVELTFAANVTNGEGPVYQWLVNGMPAGTDSIAFSTSSLADSDIVSCIVLNSSGCASGITDSSNAIAVTIDPVMFPVISIQAGDSSNTVCAGADLYFDAITNNLDSPFYQWYINGLPVGTNSDTFSSTMLVDADNVSCTVMNNSGCATGLLDSSNTITVTVIELPVVNFQANPLIITDSADTVFFTDNSTDAIDWKWYFGDSLSGSNISNQQNPWHDYINNGLYTVTLVISNTFGCSDSLTIPNYILVDIDTGSGGVGITANDEKYGFAIYPNPSTDYINLLLNLGDNKRVDLRLLNIQGKEILRSTLSFAQSNSGEYRLDLRKNELSEGLYIIDLIYKGKHYYKKVVIDSQH
ncbi:MAG: T9SS type A sorting domain-containing protein [Flavobacteriales bacterium]|nr:T9SS type A sorting domain-containing protein [Flavobacteriales bacterium]